LGCLARPAGRWGSWQAVGEEPTYEDEQDHSADKQHRGPRDRTTGRHWLIREALAHPCPPACRAGGRPEAARRAGLEFVEKVLTTQWLPCWDGAQPQRTHRVSAFDSPYRLCLACRPAVAAAGHLK